MAGAGGATVRVRIYDSRVEGLSKPGGSIWRWTRSLTKETERLAVADAPTRSGTLARGIKSSVTPVPSGCIGTVRSTAPHSLWVILGTTSPITSDRGEITVTRKSGAQYQTMAYMRLAPGKGHGVVFKQMVRGQRANNFINRAKIQALIARGVI